MYCLEHWQSAAQPVRHSLCVEVDQHGQLAVYDPLCEVFVVLDVKGDFPAWGVTKGQSL